MIAHFQHKMTMGFERQIKISAHDQEQRIQVFVTEGQLPDGYFSVGSVWCEKSKGNEEVSRVLKNGVWNRFCN